jgi:hypothetical protein
MNFMFKFEGGFGGSPMEELPRHIPFSNRNIQESEAPSKSFKTKGRGHF